MKKLYSLITILSLASLVMAQDYQLVWNEDFTEESLDRNVWNVETTNNGGGNNELQYYCEKGVSLGVEPTTGKHCLILTATKEQYIDRDCTSGRVNSKNKMYYTYGRIDARIKFPNTANGLWPAFWQMGNNYDQVGWPKCGETDIIELGHQNAFSKGTQDRYFNGACHWGESFNNGAYPNYGQFNTADYPVQGDFHLFTLIWTEDSIAMYLDQDRFPKAEPYFQLSLRGKDINEPGHYFNHPFYLVLNLSVGGFFPAMPAAEKYPELITADDPSFQRVTALPADGTPVKMYVDYIRVYEAKY